MWDAAGEAHPIPDHDKSLVIMDVVETGGPTLLSVYDRGVAHSFSPAQPFSFVLELESGELTPLVHPGDEANLLQPAGFSPEGSSTVSSTYSSPQDLVVLGPEVSVTALAEMGEINHGSLALQRAPDWAGDNTILVSGFSNGALLLTVEPAA